MSLAPNDISTLLEKWAHDKEKITKLEARIEKYKKIASKLMDKREDDTLTGREYLLTRRNQSRTTISKADVPSDVWIEYSRKISFQVFHLVKK